MIRLNSIINRRHPHTLSSLLPRQSPTHFQPLFHIANQQLSNVSQPCVRLLPAESLSFQRAASNHTDRTARSTSLSTLPTTPPSHLNLVLFRTYKSSTKLFKRNITHSPYPSKTINHNIFPSGSTLPPGPSHFPYEIVISEKHDSSENHEMWLVFMLIAFPSHLPLALASQDPKPRVQDVSASCSLPPIRRYVLANTIR